MQKNLTITTSEVKNDNHQIIKFRGEFDKAGHSDIREELDDLVQNFAAKTLVFDFSRLKFINSEGIGYLMEIHTHLINKDKKLVILSINKHVEDVFKTIGITEIIPVYEKLEDFLKH